MRCDSPLLRLFLLLIRRLTESLHQQVLLVQLLFGLGLRDCAPREVVDVDLPRCLVVDLVVEIHQLVLLLGIPAWNRIEVLEVPEVAILEPVFLQEAFDLEVFPVFDLIFLRCSRLPLVFNQPFLLLLKRLINITLLSLLRQVEDVKGVSEHIFFDVIIKW